MNRARRCWDLRQGAHLFETAATAKRVSTYDSQFPKCPTKSSAVLSIILCFPNCVTELGGQEVEVTRHRENENVRDSVQGETQRWKCKRFLDSAEVKHTAVQVTD